jgi:hypothetical protein
MSMRWVTSVWGLLGCSTRLNVCPTVCVLLNCDDSIIALFVFFIPLLALYDTDGTARYKSEVIRKRPRGRHQLVVVHKELFQFSTELRMIASSLGNSNSRGIRTARLRPFLKSLT